MCVCVCVCVCAHVCVCVCACVCVSTQAACWYLGLGLFTLHLVRRFLETAFLMRYPPHARMHVIAYVFGCVYYVVAPLSILPDSFWPPARGGVSLQAAMRGE